MSGTRATVSPMSFSDRVAGLSEEELDALTGAASWYASYAARDVAAEAQDMSAYAVEGRRSYFALVGALGKLGVRKVVPDVLYEHSRQAA